MLAVAEIVLRCPRTGLDYTIGVEMDERSFKSFAGLPDLPMKAYCPHCHAEHEWLPRDARLERTPPHRS